MKRFTLILSLLVAMVTTAMAQITANTSAYTIKSVNRGYLYYDANNAGSVTSSSHTSTVDATPTGETNEQFAFLRTENTAEDQYYLYSIGASQFVTYTGTNGVKLELTDAPACTWTLDASGDYYGIKVPGTTDTYINITYWQSVNGCKVIGTALDEGNKMTLTEVATALDLSAAIALIEEYEANLVPEVVITNAEDLNNNKVYTMVTTRGWLIYNSANPDVVASTASYTTFATGADVAACQWAIYKSATTSKYYLYNIGAGKFVGQNTEESGRFPFVAEVTNDIQVVESTTGTEYAFVFSTDNYGAINHFSHTTEPGVANWKGNASSGGLRSLDDAGSAHRLVEVGDIDTSVLEAIATAVAEYENNTKIITYKFMYNGNLVATQETEVEKGEAYPAFNVPNAPLGIVPAVSVPSETVTEDAVLEIELTVNNDLIPFEYVAEGTPSVWYYARMHGNSNVTSYIEDNGSETIEWSDKNIEASEIDSHLWGFVGDAFNGFKMVNKGTGYAIASTGAGNATMAEVASATAFHAMASDNGTAGAFCLKYKDNDNYINAQDGIIKHWNDNDNGSTFFLTEYSDEEVATVEVSAANYATLFLGEPVYIPAGVEAYVVSGAAEGWAHMEQVTGILPANTGVILKNTGNYTFTLAPARISGVGTNLLAGSLTDTEIAKEEGNSYYILADGEEGIGFYNPVLGEDETKFNNAANKAYLVVPAEQAEGIACYSFRFGEGTTGIDQITENREQSTVIYDLTGRRVENPSNGIYIINGVKVLVK